MTWMEDKDKETSTVGVKGIVTSRQYTYSNEREWRQSGSNKTI